MPPYPHLRRYAPGRRDRVVNRACAGAPQASDNCDDETTPTNGSPVLDVSKRLLTASPAPGALLSYEIIVSNTGNQNAASALVTDALPPATTFDPASSSPGWACSLSNSSPSACSVTVSFETRSFSRSLTITR